MYLILHFRQRSIDSEKVTPAPVIEQAKLIEVEKAETGSVCILMLYLFFLLIYYNFNNYFN